ncbi:MAG: carboxymuconolactone decarboxylase family protein [Candidatus Babeliales bacterium]|nr:carboxymuconolactone decarboxylase family protein [Candidatus Babeliales bacterium]
MQAKKISTVLIFLGMSITSILAENKTHIAVNQEIPGILSLFDFRPETGDIIRKLVGVLLNKESTLARSDRQLIAAYVSWLNECTWCCNVHSSVATHLLEMREDIVQAVKDDFETAPITEKLKSFLSIASKVQKYARPIPDEDIERARALGATDLEIHDVVLIAAVFCMNNRYVMCLDAWTPSDPAIYDSLGGILANSPA